MTTETSIFLHIPKTAGTTLNRIINMREMSLKDALMSRWPLSRAFENFQTRLISGVGHTVPFGECTRETLETAKENLRRYFSVVGVVERFDESLLLLQQRFGWGAIYYRKHNVSRRSPAATMADGETIQMIERHNQLDEALYQFAYELCAQQIEQAGEPLQQRLKWFQRLNRFVTLGMRLYWRARKVSVRAALRRAGRGEGMGPG